MLILVAFPFAGCPFSSLGFWKGEQGVIFLVNGVQNSLAGFLLMILVDIDEPSSMLQLNIQSPEHHTARRFTLRLIGILTVPALVLAVVAVQVYGAMADFVEQSRWVNHTFQVKQEIVSTVAAVRDAEAALRSYALAGSSARLADYYGALTKIPPGLDQLLELVSDSPIQHEAATRLQGAFIRRQQNMAILLEIFQKGGRDAVKASPQASTSQEEDKTIDAIEAEMLAREDKLLVQRQLKSVHIARTTKTLTLGAIGLSFAMMFLALAITLREQRRRMASDASVKKSNQQLADALNSARRLSQSLRQLSNLGDILQSCHSVNEALSTLRKTIPTLLPDFSGSINLINASQNLVEPAVSWGEADQSKLAIFSPDECWALRRGHVFPEHDGALPIPCPHTHDLAIGSVQLCTLCVPLLAQGQMLGTLFLYGQDAMSDDLRGVAIAIAEHISMSIANLKLQESLRHQSLRDSLTGLYNRRYLEASLSREMARCMRNKQSLAVLMLDIDHFKSFNDKYGHQAGDVVLAQFSSMLTSLMRAEDVVCRYGGEEFTILLLDTDANAARKRAEEVCEATRALTLEYRRQALSSITVSIGIAMHSADGEDPNRLMRLADEALYRAKHEGRNRYCFAGSAPTTFTKPVSGVLSVPHLQSIR